MIFVFTGRVYTALKTRLASYRPSRFSVHRCVWIFIVMDNVQYSCEDYATLIEAVNVELVVVKQHCMRRQCRRRWDIWYARQFNVRPNPTEPSYRLKSDKRHQNLKKKQSDKNDNKKTLHNVKTLNSRRIRKISMKTSFTICNHYACRLRMVSCSMFVCCTKTYTDYLGPYQLITFRFIFISLLLCTLCVLSKFY